MAIRFGNIAVAYFIIGAVMFAGGGIAYDQIGLPSLVVDLTGDQVQPGENVSEDVENLRGPGQSVQALSGGPLILVWDFLTGLAGFLFWPLMTLWTHDAPTVVTVLLGGTPTISFWLGFIIFIRRST